MTVLRMPGVPMLPDSGWLYDDASVFGLFFTDTGAVPRLDGWLAADVAARVTRKAETGCGGVDEDGWWSVAELAAGCETLADLRPGPAAVEVCTRTFAGAWHLSRRLPCPPRSLRTPPSVSLAHELGCPPSGLAAAELRDVAQRLTAVLADDGWTDADTVAGWVHDAMFALALYRRTLRNHPAVAPAPAGRSILGDRRRPGGPVRSLTATNGRGGGTRTEATTSTVTRPFPRARAPVSCLRGSRPERPGPHAA